MTAALTAGDLRQLRTALAALLAPLDAASPAAWRRRAAAELATLLGADGCGIVMAVPGEPLGVGVGQWGGSAQAALNTFTDHYFGQNPVDVRRRRLGARVWTRTALWSRAERERSAYFNDWCRPHRNLDSLGMSASCPPGAGRDSEAAAFITAAAADRFAPGGREEQLLALMQPAFAAGVAMLTLAQSWREAFGAALDLADAPLAIVRGDGALVHATPALLALVAADTAGSTLLAAVQTQARALARAMTRGPRGRDLLPTPMGSVATTARHYELRATLVRVAQLGRGPVCLVLVRPPHPIPSAGELTARFRLTPREAQVALLLARGERDRAIAATLGIRLSTARHHVEHVLPKLGVQARAAVAARIGQAS